MPSTKDPSTVVNPTPGKLAAGEVHASSLAFPLAGGGGNVAAHIADPSDAHVASAIGIPDTYPATGEPLRASVGGPYDGETVLDALNALKDLLPVKPDLVGFDNGAIPNSGLPDWNGLHSTVVKGGFTNLSGQGVVTKYLTQRTPGTYNLTGTCFPADRGVLCLYQTSNSDFFNPGQTTLLAALWLGSNPPPAGLASADFDSAQKTAIQPAKATSPATPGAAGTYTPSMVGIDRISLSDRYPYQQSYPGSVFSGFSSNFFNYQLCHYSIPITLAAGQTGSYLLVHWREQYATSLAAVQPSGLTPGTLNATNCYSATTAPNYDNVQRANLFLETSPAGATPGTITTTPAGVTTTTKLSGVSFYASNGLQFNVTATATNLFANSYFTNSIASASVPAGFESPNPPVHADMTDFGGVSHAYQLYDDPSPRVLNHSSGNPYTLAAPPATGDTARFQHPTQPIVPSGLPTQVAPYPYGQVKVRFNTPFAAAAQIVDSKFYLFNTMSLTGSTTTSETFTDERYRYPNSFTVVAASPMIPASPYNSNTTLDVLVDELQVYSGKLVYPSVNFTLAAYQPNAGQPDYATVLSSDPANRKRRYQRVFNTGIARNTGTLTISGLAFSAFQTSGPIDAAELTDHPGGAIVQIKVPGQTGWLDLGRAKGDPDLATTDFRGCRTGVAGSSYTYDTTAFTAPNGSGEYLIIVRVTFIKNGPGQALTCDSISWAP